ncbi:hypothetical protein TorRG33x02_151410 [Trema orientale]|uniref:RNase H type-1 domain-containing protein n=1 Tax=Trema orientale TaxID=63057 RepID=A0A2P5EU76_TREOI|nr:hypothetical protein TorRG33x02_151410 [Trema orientale]
MAECLALREGTSFALRYGFVISEVESDSKKICSALQSFDPLSKESPILSDIIVNLNLLGNTICNFIPRNRNKVAYILSSYGLHSDSCSVWLAETPTCVSMAVYEDCELQ